MSLSLLKKLSLVRKALLTRMAHGCFAQYGEDIVLREWTRGRDTGFYVDVGCWHPKRFSNTYALYKRGWRGINIDLDEEKVFCFEIARPQDTNIVAALSDKVETAQIYADKDFSLGATIIANGSAPSGVSPRGTITTTTLTSVLDASIYRDRTIDVLSIDTEGSEANILRGLDFARYRPRFVLIEVWADDVSVLMESEVHQLLAEHGYRLGNWVGPTAFYRGDPRT